MDAAEIREMSAEDIALEIDDTREELMRLRFQQTTGELTDHNQMKTARRKIARLITVLNERKLAEEKEGEE
ncbi:MAG: 50S ribosomal protein L29 [Chloroflexota bacterium]